MLMISTSYVQAAEATNDDTDSMSNYEILLDQGYPQDYLDTLTSGMMQRMVELIGDGYVADVDIQTSSGGDELDNLGVDMLSEYGSISNLSYTIALATICKKDSKVISSVAVVLTWEWKENKPAYRGKDFISVNWDTNVFCYEPDSFGSSDYYKTKATDDWSVSNEYNAPQKLAQGGLGFKTDLKMLKKYVGGGAAFVLSPATKILKNGSNKTTIQTEYVHTKSLITGIDFSISGVGVGITWDNACESDTDSAYVKYEYA